jgi:hypothetical protein
MRKQTNATRAAVHVPGTNSPATTMPATSSMTMRPWSCPGKIRSARSAAQKAITRIATTRSHPVMGARCLMS